MKTVQRRSLVDQVIDQIMDEINSRRWPVGSQIPTESVLVDRYGVSRSSVREATKALVQQGLLATRQGVGTTVIARDVTEVAMRRALLNAQPHEVLSVRGALDVLACAEAASARTDDELAALERNLLDRNAAITAKDFESFVEHDVAFHLTLVQASHNHLLIALYQSFDESLRHSIASNDLFFSIDQLTEHEPHSLLLSAIRHQDRQGAREAARAILSIAHGHEPEIFDQD
ncbi:FadR/GntR family transcriptional regulator [Glutamicibacter sp.]|uniref:FadR/GntR family transcriptional regulator n=1 Tax=Glutamicibacter sp. TaxID=1931995 RepID=UPI0028BD6E0D|nr:FadR/GntR family transcriptional regulator [Glutamicibacter sp.]